MSLNRQSCAVTKMVGPSKRLLAIGYTHTVIYVAGVFTTMSQEITISVNVIVVVLSKVLYC